MFKRKWYKKNKEIEKLLLNDSHKSNCEKVLRDIKQAFPFQYAELQRRGILSHHVIQSWIKAGKSPCDLGDHVFDYMKQLKGHCLGYQREYINNIELNLYVNVDLYHRRRHQYNDGSTGSGKTNSFLNQIKQDLIADYGYTIISDDPDMTDLCLDMIMRYAPQRLNQVHYFDPLSDMPIPLNPFYLKESDNFNLKYEETCQLLNNVLEISSDVMQRPLNHAVFACLKYPDSTLKDIKVLLTQNSKRNQIINNLVESEEREYWYSEFKHIGQQTINAILTRLDYFISFDSPVKNVCCLPGCLNIREIMDNRDILIVNLAHGLIGDKPSELLGKLFFVLFRLSFLSRGNVSIDRRPFHILYSDEFYKFAVYKNINSILSDSRKYNLGCVLSTQYSDQLPQNIVNSITHNVAIMLIFRTGSPEASKLSKMFLERTDEGKLISKNYLEFIDQGLGEAIFKIDEFSGKINFSKYPVSLKEANQEYISTVKEASRNNYGVQAQKIKELVDIENIVLNDPFMKRDPEKFFVEIETN